jgi:hypothetical protein
MFLLPIILGLLCIIWTLFLACVQIIVAFVLALLAGALFILRAALPYLLRGGCIVLFVFGWLQGVLGTNALYTQLTDALGALFVAAALGVVLIALPVRSLMVSENVWSAFALAGALGFGCASVCALAQSNFVLQWLARGLPVSLTASGLIYIAVTNKYRRVVRESQHAGEYAHSE